jgi:hypothetical protein
MTRSSIGATLGLLLAVLLAATPVPTLARGPQQAGVIEQLNQNASEVLAKHRRG